jgi:hypothetical protein
VLRNPLLKGRLATNRMFTQHSQPVRFVATSVTVSWTCFGKGGLVARSWRVNDAVSRHLRDVHAAFPDQLVAAGALFESVSPNDFDGMSSVDEFWDRKHVLAERSGLLLSVARCGVRTPLVLSQSTSGCGTETLLNGHRRLMAAVAHDWDMPIPYLRYGQTFWF